MGKVMSALMPKVGGRADGKRVSAAVRERLAGSAGPLARRQLTLDNTVAAELAGSEDAVLRELEGRLGCDFHLRGNVLTLDGDDGDVRRRRGGGRRAGRADRARTRARAGDDRTGGRRARRQREPGGDPRRRGLAPPQHQGRAEDAEPEALRRLDPRPHGHLRDRPGRNRQDLPRGRDGGRGARRARGAADHPHPARGRGRASGSASCPATSRPRSTPTCGRSSTPSTTCSTPTASTATSSAA